jgi:hypothetical protein
MLRAGLCSPRASRRDSAACSKRRALDNFNQPDVAGIEKGDPASADRWCRNHRLYLGEPCRAGLNNRGCDVVRGVTQVMNLKLIALPEFVGSCGFVERMNQLDERLQGVRALADEEDKLGSLITILYGVTATPISKRGEASLSGSEIVHDEPDVVHTPKHA